MSIHCDSCGPCLKYYELYGKRINHVCNSCEGAKNIHRSRNCDGLGPRCIFNCRTCKGKNHVCKICGATNIHLEDNCDFGGPRCVLGMPSCTEEKSASKNAFDMKILRNDLFEKAPRVVSSSKPVKSTPTSTSKGSSSGGGFAAARACAEKADIVGIILEKDIDSKVDSYACLLIQQRSAALEGYKSFPGGRRERGENPFDGALREFQEETGLALTERNATYVTYFRTAQKSGKVVVNFYLKANDSLPVSWANRGSGRSESGDMEAISGISMTHSTYGHAWFALSGLAKSRDLKVVGLLAREVVKAKKE